jgi:dienelactone hydrolase
MHTYVVNQSLGRAVLDSVRAAVRASGSALAANAPVLLWGYSEGGAASAAAAEQHPSYAPELDVRAVASGAAPADMPAVGQYQDGQLGFGSVLAGSIGFDAAYPELNLDAYLTEAGRAAVAQASEMCIVPLIATFAGKRMTDYSTTNLSEVPAWRARFDENKLGNVAPRVPVYLYHGVTDQVIPVAVGRALRDAYCAGGTTVTWKEYPDVEHIWGQVAGFQDAGNWLADRLAGSPPPSSCPPGGTGGTGGAGGTSGSGGNGGGVSDCACGVASSSPARTLGWSGCALLALVAGGLRRRARPSPERSTPPE